MAGLPTSKRSAREVAANVAALRLALENAVGHELGTAFFDGVHATLFPDQSWVGQIRTVQNWIGGSDYSPRHARFVPPHPDRVPGLMDDLAAFAARDDLPALAQASIAHAQFEAIHPYADGNGRVGRALTHVIMRRRDATVRKVVEDLIDHPVCDARQVADRNGVSQSHEAADIRGGVRTIRVRTPPRSRRARAGQSSGVSRTTGMSRVVLVLYSS